jgi:hypothetical protein
MNNFSTEISIDPGFIIFTFDFVETKVSNIGLISDYKKMSNSAKNVFNLLTEHVKIAEKKFRLKNQLKLAFNSFDTKFRIIVYLDLINSQHNDMFGLASALKQYFTESMQKLKNVMEAIKTITSEGKRPKLDFSAGIDAEVSVDSDGTIKVREKDREIVSLADKLSSQSNNSYLQSISIRVGDDEITLPTTGTKVIKEKFTDKSKPLTMQVIIDCVKNSTSEFEFKLPNESRSNIGRFKGDETRKKLLNSQIENTSLICIFYVTTLSGLTTEQIIDYELVSIDETTPKLF